MESIGKFRDNPALDQCLNRLSQALVRSEDYAYLLYDILLHAKTAPSSQNVIRANFIALLSTQTNFRANFEKAIEALEENPEITSFAQSILQEFETSKTCSSKR